MTPPFRRYRVKITVESARALLKSGTPTFVIDGILGKVIQCDDNCNTLFPFDGTLGKWNIPAECLEAVDETKPQ